MSITITALQSLFDTSNFGTPTPYASASYTPPAGRLLIAYIATCVASGPADPQAIRIVTLQASGYVACVAGDLGKTVTDDGGSTGILLDYNNTTRVWYINWTTPVVVGSVMAITTGTGAGTSSADAAGEGVTGNGVTWTQKAFQNDIGATPTMRLMVYTAFSGASPTNGALKTIYAAAQAGQCMSISAVAGADLSGTPNAAIVQAPKGATGAATVLSIALAAPSGGLNRFMSGFIHLAAEVTNPRNLVPGVQLSWKEIHDGSFATPNAGFETQSLENDQERTASATWTTSSVMAGIAIEIKANLTVTTDLVTIADAETATGWTTIGAAGTGALAVEPDFSVQGTQCLSRGYGAGSVLRGGSFDIGAGNVLNFGAAGAAYGKLVYVWVRMTAQAIMETRANGGLQIVVGSGATGPGSTGTAYNAGVLSAWYVGGSDFLPAEDGWVCAVIDPTLPPSTTFGGGVDLTAARWFGAACTSNAGTAKGQVFAIDAVRYGLGEILCNGIPDVGLGFKSMADADFGTAYNKWGIIQEKAGVFLVKGKVVIGDSVATAATAFTSQDETVIWQRPTYWDGTRERACVRELNPNTGKTYFGLDFRGNATGDTAVTFGVKVGSGDAASGRSGTTFIGGRTKTTFSYDDGAVEGVTIYGSSFKNIRGGIDMSANASTDEFIGNTVVRCGSLLAGPSKVRACTFIDGLGGSYRLFEDFRNDGTAVQQLSVADPLCDWTDRLNGSSWSVPSGVEYVELLAPTTNQRQVTQPDAADTGASITIAVAAGPPGTFTRSAGGTGSFLVDGFKVGDVIVTSGFAAGGNSGTFTIRNLTATIITVADTLTGEAGGGNERILAKPFETAASGDHYAEAVLNWPSSGAGQGSLGVIIRGSDKSGNPEDYWYLKVDLVNNQMTLVRCDNGADTAVTGPTTCSPALVEDTDYLVQLIGRGTLIEGFVNGQKIAATSSTFQTNLRVGIRGDGLAAQTGGAPRLSRFGAGPITNALGAIVLASATDDMGYSSFINNTRATDLTTTGTYGFTSVTFSGNIVDLRDDSSGTTTVNCSTGSPVKLEEVDDAATTVVNTKTLYLTNIKSGSEVRIYKTSDMSVLAGIETSGTTFDYAYSYAGDIGITIVIFHLDWTAFRDTATLGSADQTIKINQIVDRVYVNP